VKYSSLIARAQKMQEAQNMVRAFQTIQPMVQIFPEVRDVLRIEDATRSIWDLYGNPAKLLYDEEEVERKRKIQQQQALKLQEQQEELHKSEVAKNNAPMVSAVGQLAQAQQPQSQGQ
jgi:hypothetical protein